MNKTVGKRITFFLVLMIVLSSTVMVFAYSYTYNSYYDMTGGVFTQLHNYTNSNNGMSITLYPTLGEDTIKLHVSVVKKTLLGYENVTDVNKVSSLVESTSTFSKLPTNIDLRGYVRNFTGKRVTGNSTITFWE